MAASDERWLKLMKAGRSFGCHQMPERSFFFKGYQFPVCARCTGILVGEFLTLIPVFFFNIGILFSILLLLPMALDGILQRLGIFESNNIRRVVTGFLGGIGLIYIYRNVIGFIFSIVI